MFRDVHQAEVAVARVLPALSRVVTPALPTTASARRPGPFGVDDAKRIVAEALAVGTDWGSTVKVLEAGAAVYPVDWYDAARRRYNNWQRPGDRGYGFMLPAFVEVFPDQPEVDLPELAGLSVFDAMRVVASRARPYHLVTRPELRSRNARPVKQETLLAGDLQIEFGAAKYHAEIKLLGTYAWWGKAFLNGEQVGHAYGDMYVTSRGRWLDPSDALYAADEISDADVSNVRALCKVLGGLKGGVATFSDVYLVPAARGRGLGREMLFSIALALKSTSSLLGNLAFDIRDASEANVFPSGLTLDGQRLPAKRLVAEMFERYLEPLAARLVERRLELLKAPLSDQLQRHQVMALIGADAAGADLDDIVIPGEEDLREALATHAARLMRL